MDSIRATPMQYPTIGLLSDKLKEIEDFVKRSYAEHGVDASTALNLLGIPAVQQTAERIAYGEPLTTGKGMTTQVRPEVMEAAMTLLPMAGTAAKAGEKAAMAAGRAGERYAEKVIPQIMERGGMPAGLLDAMATNTTSKMFIGASSPMFDKDMALKASQMAKKGSSPQEIWQVTGTVKGPDGQWRQEISDVGSSIIEDKLPTNYIEGYGDVPAWKLEQSLEHPNLYASYPNLKDIRNSFRSGGSAYATYNPGMDWISYNKEIYEKGFIPKDIQEKLTKAKKLREDFYKSDEFVKYDKKLNDVLDETNDFNSIDGLLDPKIEAKREKLNNDYYGLLRQAQADTSSGSTLGSGQKAKKTTLHEIQHAIQEREGFATGGSPEQFKDQAKAVEARDILNWATQLRKKAEEMPGADSIAIDAALRKEYEGLGATDLIPNAEIRQKALQPSTLYPDKYESSEVPKMESLVKLYGLDKRTEPLKSGEVYKNLMGEAEARLVERRMNLTPEQLRQNFPFEYTGDTGYGLDVNPNDLLYFDEKGKFIRRGLLD